VLWLVLSIGIAVVFSACGADSTSPTGTASPEAGSPLALVEPAEMRVGTSTGSGPISIADECVTVDTLDGVQHLVWFSDEVQWDEEERSITYADNRPNTPPVTFRDGDVVDLGGTLPWDEMVYVTPPPESCEGKPLVIMYMRLHDPD
jgi:hypothetical protein